MPEMYSLGDVRDRGAGTWEYVQKPILLAHVVSAAILNALAFYSGHQESAAVALGLSPRAMSYQMQRYGIPTARSYIAKAERMFKPRGRYAVRKTR